VKVNPYPVQFDNLVTRKKELRESLKSSQIPAEILSEESSRLRDHLDLFLSRQTGVWAGFRSMPSEPPLEPSLLKASHITWVYPRIVGDQLEFYELGDEGYTKGVFQIEEPVPEAKRFKSISMLSGVLVPALGFDIHGRRLGRGRGYYDRALENSNVIKAGVAFRHHVLAELPEEAHDVKMDFVVTSAGVIRCNQQINSKVRG
jgi:5-formyltetrahydrofolate cyclo-ligase